MHSSPRIYIRPVQSRDLALIDGWRKSPAWPKHATALFSNIDRNLNKTNKDRIGISDHIFIAERTYDQLPIGLAHLSTAGLPRGIAQFSACIPEKRHRAPGRGADLSLLTFGVGFWLGFDKLMLVDVTDSAIMSVATKAGYKIDEQWRPPNRTNSENVDGCILTLTREEWTRLWQTEFEVKAMHVPYLRDLLASPRQPLEADDFDEALEFTEGDVSLHDTVRLRDALVIPPRKVLG